MRVHHQENPTKMGGGGGGAPEFWCPLWSWLMYIGLLIYPCKFQEFPLKGKKFPLTETIALFGQNWPKWALPLMRKLRACTQAQVRRSICSFLDGNKNFKGIRRWNHSDWTKRSQVVCWNMISNWNWQFRYSCANTTDTMPCVNFLLN